LLAIDGGEFNTSDMRLVYDRAFTAEATMAIIEVHLPANPDTSEAEEVILDIIALKGGEFAGKTLLYKAFYLAHLYYWEKQEGVLTRYPVVSMPEGPGIDDGDELIVGLLRAGRITRYVEPYGPYQREVFKLVAQRPVDPTSKRQDAVRDALAFIGNKTARQVCDEIHEFSTSWKASNLGDQLPIYLDLLTSEQRAAVRGAAKEVDDLFRETFGE
jgi:hypothetical protein